MKRFLVLLACIAGIPFPAFCQSSGLIWGSGQILTAAQMQSFDTAKVNVASGSSTNQKLDTPVINGGSASGQTIGSPAVTGGTLTSTDISLAVATALNASVSRSLNARLNDSINVLDYGAIGDGSTDNGAAFVNATAAAEAHNMEVNFPYSSTGYVVNTGTFTNKMLGRFNFNGNVLSGTALGTPGTGAGVYNSLYTNPWLIVADTKEELDPAALTLPSSGSALIGHAVECLPNRPNTGDTVTTKRMVACLYAGADTGTGGASGTDYSMEVRNDVLNLDTNSGAAYEIDLNFNGTVADGQYSRGLFITGGGTVGNNTNSVGIDIQHSDYSAGLLPWSTGISIRDATVALQTYARSDGTGFLYEGFNSSGTLVSKIDNNGYGTFANITGTTLAGTGNAYACINSSGQLYRSSSAC